MYFDVIDANDNGVVSKNELSDALVFMEGQDDM